MPQTCPRCQRVNPNSAAYCYYDGVVLNVTTAPAGGLARPLVMPGGRVCRTLEELATGLRRDWSNARQLFTSGALSQLFRDNGRADLSRAAEEARAVSDPDLGLYQLLGQLPVPTGPMPRLEVAPRRLVLGPYPVGGQHQTNVRIGNRGAGTLCGKIKIADDAPWLRLTGARGDSREDDLVAETSQSVGLWIDTRGLASGQTYGTKLILVTNGGLAEVPVAVEITAVPYPAAPFKGATTPRRLAELMRAQPKEAIAALERGEVARWFASNGWAYPVTGAAAPGMGGVQQLFECMGVTKPPRLELSPAVVDLVSERGRSVEGEVVLRAASKKWVYAQVESSAPWLLVTESGVSGPQLATVKFEADPAQLPDGTTEAEAELRVLANAGTRLSVKVRLEVRRPTTARKPARGRTGGSDWTRALLAGAVTLLLYRMLAILPADLIGRLFASGPPTPGSLSAWLTTPGTADGFLRRFVLATWWLGGLVGVLLAWKREGRLLDLLAGVFAGAAAGLAVAATLGCVLIVGDEFPRRLLALVAARDSTLPVAVATLVWLIVACGCWAIIGVVLGLTLPRLGATGRFVLGGLVTPIRVTVERIGAKGLAELFRFR